MTNAMPVKQIAKIAAMQILVANVTLGSNLTTQTLVLEFVIKQVAKFAQITLLNVLSVNLAST